jgi:hypothetical protein
VACGTYGSVLGAPIRPGARSPGIAACGGRAIIDMSSVVPTAVAAPPASQSSGAADHAHADPQRSTGGRRIRPPSRSRRYRADATK